MEKPRIEWFRSKENGEWYFRVVAKNYKTVCQSEGYVTKQNCIRGIEALKLAVTNSEIVEVG